MGIHAFHTPILNTGIQVILTYFTHRPLTRMSPRVEDVIRYSMRQALDQSNLGELRGREAAQDHPHDK
jgi:type IV secretory pathway ATPase VirB11/archaellum biosynthesis ATPase